jgi:hydrogenase expression/formation protein HypD
MPEVMAVPQPSSAMRSQPAGLSSEPLAELLGDLNALCRGSWRVMEVCGGQTHAIVRSGLDRLLPAGLTLIHGPGCPVCVTPVAVLDGALRLARRPEVILCSYGDMLRVPGSGNDRGSSSGVAGDDLLAARAAGGDVRLLTSPLQALELARRHPDRQVVFLAVGFETTAPASALLAQQALALGLPNLSLLTAHVRVVPAMQAILAAPDNCIQGFLAAGHVCAITGTEELTALVRRWRVPVVVTGFSVSELLLGLRGLVEQLETGRAELANAYAAVVRPHGNPVARRLLAEVFEPVTLSWRGLGPIPAGGLALRGAYAELEASRRFQLPTSGELATQQPAAGEACPAAAGWGGASPAATDGSGTDGSGTDGSDADSSAADGVCLAAAVLQGRLRPPDCPSFGRRCRPDQPLGAPMVSSEGACAAYWQYRR